MPIRISGLNSGLDTESLVQELVSAYRTKTDKYIKEQTAVSWKQEAWKNLSAKTRSFRTSLDKLRFSTSFQMKKTTVSNAAKASVTAANNAVDGTQSLEVKQMAKAGFLTGGTITTPYENTVTGATNMAALGFASGGSFTINGEQIDIDASTTINDVVAKLNDAGVKASFDEKNHRIFISSKGSGKDADFSLNALNEGGREALSKLGLLVKPAQDDSFYDDLSALYSGKSDDELKALFENFDLNATGDANRLIANYAKQYQNADDPGVKQSVVDSFKELVKDVDAMRDKMDELAGYNEDAVRVYGQDAEIYLNGAQFTSNSNTFEINGLTIDVTGTTEPGEVISLTTSTDSQGVYDKIKDFLTSYNELINALTDAYNADRDTKDYQPLSDDDKEAMSEKEIEKWEEKGKSGILRRDTQLNTLISLMTGAMSKSYKVGEKSYALSTFGIKTLGIMNAEKNEHNAYHIDGDADDDSTSSNADQLMKAITEDPDGVAGFFQQLASNLYDELGKQMSSTTLRSYGSFYNDKELQNEYDDYSETIKKWEQKVQDMEESYYKKFSAMESALAQLNSQQSSLSGLLGM